MDGENNGSNPMNKWMIWGKNTPIFGNTHFCNYLGLESPSLKLRMDYWAYSLGGFPLINVGGISNHVS